MGSHKGLGDDFELLRERERGNDSLYGVSTMTIAAVFLIYDIN